MLPPPAPLRASVPAGFATRLSWPLLGDARLLTEAIQAIEDFAVGYEPLDVAVMRAVGWAVERRAVRRGRPAHWWARSPVSSVWVGLPRPTIVLTDTRRLVPNGWCWGTGERGGHAFGWVAARHPIAEGVPWFECNGMSPELALTRAALFARRQLAMAREGMAA